MAERDGRTKKSTFNQTQRSRRLLLFSSCQKCLSNSVQQIVLRLELNCEKCKRRAMKTLAGISGVDSIDIKANESQIVVNGNADPVCLTASLRKFGFAELVSVGPLKMEKEKKEKEDKQEKISCVVLPKCCDRCSGYTYYWREETVYSCSIQ